MAFVARHFLMLAEQREGRQRMVKQNRNVPAILAVTRFAGLAFLTHVRVVFAMT